MFLVRMLAAALVKFNEGLELQENATTQALEIARLGFLAVLPGWAR